MNTKKRMIMQRLLSGVLALLGFSACSEEDGEDQVYMYGTIPLYYIRSVVTDANEKPIEGIRTVLEYKGIDGELFRDTVFTDAKGETEQDFAAGMMDLQNSKAKLKFEDVDDEKNGSYQDETVEFSVKEVYIGGEIVRVTLKEKKNE